MHRFWKPFHLDKYLTSKSWDSQRARSILIRRKLIKPFEWSSIKTFNKPRIRLSSRLGAELTLKGLLKSRFLLFWIIDKQIYNQHKQICRRVSNMEVFYMIIKQRTYFIGSISGNSWAARLSVWTLHMLTLAYLLSELTPESTFCLATLHYRTCQSHMGFMSMLFWADFERDTQL